MGGWQLLSRKEENRTSMKKLCSA